MQLIAVGLNHKTAPVEIRERFSIPKERVRGGLIALSSYETVSEAVVLSTDGHRREHGAVPLLFCP